MYILLNEKNLIQKLENKGLIFKNKIRAEKILKNISYYKIKEFSYFFIDENKKYKDNTFFEDIYNLYLLDKELRMQLLSLIEIIELSVKNNIIKILSKKNIFDYYNINNWVDIKLENLSLIENKIKMKNEKILKENSSLEYKVVKNYKKKYDVKVLPIYVIMEEITLGEITEIMDFMRFDNLKELAEIYFENTKDFTYEIEIIKNIRNRSAHNNDLVTEKYDGLNILEIIEIIKKYIRIIDDEYNFDNINKISEKIKNII